MLILNLRTCTKNCKTKSSLLSCTEDADTPIEQTKAKAKQTIEFKWTKPCTQSFWHTLIQKIWRMDVGITSSAVKFSSNNLTEKNL